MLLGFWATSIPHWIPRIPIIGDFVYFLGTLCRRF